MADIFIVRLSWIYVLLVMCIVNLTHQASPSDIGERFNRLESLILTKLADIDYKLSNVDSVLRKIDPSVVSDMKLKVDEIAAEMVAYGKRSEQGTTVCDTVSEDTSISEIKAQSASISEIKAQSASIVENIKLVKQDVNLVGAKLDLLTVSNSAITIKIDTLEHQLKQGIRQSQETTTLKEIKLVDEKNYLFEAAINNLTLNSCGMASKLEMMKTNINDSFNQILSKESFILKEIEEVKEHEIAITSTLAIISSTTIDMNNEIDGFKKIVNITEMNILKVIQDLCLPPFKKLPKTNECFYVSKEELSWDDARDACQEMGGDLAVPRDFNALKELFSTISKGALYYYVGGHDRAAPQTKHSWINGEAVTGPWGSCEPDFTEEENCLIVRHSDGKLYDVGGCSSASRTGYICQKGFIN